MKKNYFLIVGILILLFVGGYFGVQKFLDNGDEAVVEKENTEKENRKENKSNIESVIKVISNKKLIIQDPSLIVTPIWYKDGESFIAYNENENLTNIYKVNLLNNQKQELLISLNNKKVMSLMLNNEILHIKYYDAVDKKIKYSSVSNMKLLDLDYLTKELKNKFYKSYFGPTEVDRKNDIEVGMLKQDNGYDITQSDLYIKNILSGEKNKITDTPNIIELFPFFHPNGTSIIYWVKNNESHKMEPYILTYKN